MGWYLGSEHCDCVCLPSPHLFGESMAHRHVEVRGQLEGVVYLLPSCGFWGPILCHQAWQQIPSHTEPILQAQPSEMTLQKDKM